MALPSVSVIDQARLKPKHFECELGRRGISLGNWAFYVRELELKLLHAVDGLVHCIHRTAPGRSELFAGQPFDVAPQYTCEDWRRAFERSVLQRTAENFVAAKRLHDAGLGPSTKGICIVRRSHPWYSHRPCVTAGIFVDDLHGYRRKAETTEQQMIAAGVAPDRIKSCVRQQINGYVIDLNSVVGVTPIDAEDEVRAITSMLEEICKTKA